MENVRFNIQPANTAIPNSIGPGQYIDVIINGTNLSIIQHSKNYVHGQSIDLVAPGNDSSSTLGCVHWDLKMIKSTFVPIAAPDVITEKKLGSENKTLPIINKEETSPIMAVPEKPPADKLFLASEYQLKKIEAMMSTKGVTRDLSEKILRRHKEYVVQM